MPIIRINEDFNQRTWKVIAGHSIRALKKPASLVKVAAETTSSATVIPNVITLQEKTPQDVFLKL